MIRGGDHQWTFEVCAFGRTVTLCPGWYCERSNLGRPKRASGGPGPPGRGVLRWEIFVTAKDLETQRTVRERRGSGARE